MHAPAALGREERRTLRCGSWGGVYGVAGKVSSRPPAASASRRPALQFPSTSSDSRPVSGWRIGARHARRQSDPDISGLQDGAVRSGVLGGECGFFGFRVRIGRGVPQTGLVARECGLCGPGTGYTARGRSFCKPDEQGVQTGIGVGIIAFLMGRMVERKKWCKE